jgi:hypothetical protein
MVANAVQQVVVDEVAIEGLGGCPFFCVLVQPGIALFDGDVIFCKQVLLDRINHLVWLQGQRE